MAHTPGPWKAVRVGNTKVTQAIIAERENHFHLVATARPLGVSSAGCQEDNARLIAAAPDLLELCEQAYQELTNWFMATGPGEGPSEILLGAMDAVIKEAKGTGDEK